MRVMLISQCSKNALVETRRIIDHFAERKGSRVWETHITQQGLHTLKKLLMSKARKNTAVACHLFKGQQEPELLWIVGNSAKFDKKGLVPTRITKKDILRASEEDNWRTGEAIAILCGISGLFHDIGKASDWFQAKLRPKKKKKLYEPFRHEWISLLLFKSFVGSCNSDKEWLERLSRISVEDEELMIRNFPKASLERKANPFDQNFPPLATFIGWLIVSHHKLPVNPEVTSDSIENWMIGKRFTAKCNLDYKNFEGLESKEKDEIQKNIGSFRNGTPFVSQKWRLSAQSLASRALNCFDLLQKNWFEDRFSMHLARACLMLADHVYSSGPANEKYQDPSYYDVYANTCKEKKVKQKLDEHCIQVANIAVKFAKYLPNLKNDLPTISANLKRFKKRNQNQKFLWQDQAYDLAKQLNKSSNDQGFFGINLASTGSGKTLANARIMYGLSDEGKCRFTIALGLRVLTLQTGDSLKQKLGLNDEDIAILIGGKDISKLQESEIDNTFDKEELLDPEMGSESLEEIIDQSEEVVYKHKGFNNCYLNKLLKFNPKLQDLLNAPLLVSTIDHIISATESKRGGKQIIPLLRLLTSDLVLDEPDEFDINDMHALYRLVNFAGVFGAKILLSSATLTPSIVQALFEAYAEGRKVYNKVRGKPNAKDEICCAWFDEFGVDHGNYNKENYLKSHEKFVEERIAHLNKQPPIRKAALSPVSLIEMQRNNDFKQSMAESIGKSIYELHDHHHQIHPESNKKVSIGLVRFSKINTLVNIAKLILSASALPNYRLHFCVYHSRFPLLVRSYIERKLDSILDRSNPNQIWENSFINSSLSLGEEINHIFIVFASPVSEVGRDHDYDWAIIEPSSMRSIIQASGRVQRHRQQLKSQPNIILLPSNFDGLKGEDIAFCKPGFENKDLQLDSKDLSDILNPEQYEVISSIPRLSISHNLDPTKNLVDLEHKRLAEGLFGPSGNYSSLWGKHEAHWCANLQDLTPFRKRTGEKEYIMYLSDEDKEPCLHESVKFQIIGDKSGVNNKIKDVHLKLGVGVHPWIKSDLKQQILKFSKIMNQSVSEISFKFCRVNLKFCRVNLYDVCNSSNYHYHPLLGFYNEI